MFVAQDAAVDMVTKELNIIAIIPARGGSEGLPGKNLRPFAGKPLVAHTIDAATESVCVKAVYVTTDNADIARTAKRHGAATIARPEHLASSTASSESALRHAIEHLEAKGEVIDLVVFLQCTSPLRTAADIDLAVMQIVNDGADSLLSVCPSHRFLWEFVDGEPKAINYDHHKRPRRQDMRPQYVENGAIYIFKPWVLTVYGNRLGGRIALHIMPHDQDMEIDTLRDFMLAEYLFTTGNSENDSIR